LPAPPISLRECVLAGQRSGEKSDLRIDVLRAGLSAACIAAGGGAPLGITGTLYGTGLYMAEAIATRLAIRAQLRDSQELMERF